MSFYSLTDILFICPYHLTVFFFTYSTTPQFIPFPFLAIFYLLYAVLLYFFVHLPLLFPMQPKDNPNECSVVPGVGSCLNGKIQNLGRQCQMSAIYQGGSRTSHDPVYRQHRLIKKNNNKKQQEPTIYHTSIT